MPRDIERLLALSLATEDAVRGERWDEVGDLLRSRDPLLAYLETHGVDNIDGTTLERVREADARIATALSEMRSSLVEEIAQAFQTRRAQGAYAPPASTQGTRWDRAG